MAQEDIIFIIVVCVLVFLALRELNTWYWKVNKIVQLLQRINGSNRIESVINNLETIINQLNHTNRLLDNLSETTIQDNTEIKGEIFSTEKTASNEKSSYNYLSSDNKEMFEKEGAYYEMFENEINEKEGFYYKIFENVDYNNISGMLNEYYDYIRKIINYNAVVGSATFEKKEKDDNWYYIEGEYESKAKNKRLKFIIDIIADNMIYYDIVLYDKSISEWGEMCENKREKYLNSIGY